MDNHDATEQTLAAIAAGQYDHLLLDFDHTLLLDNSTERFLDSLRPRLLAFLLVAASDWIVRALAWFGWCRYNDQRDFMRVAICTMLMPWNHFIWPSAVRRLARDSMNRALLDALPPDTPVVVLSFGFRHIIKPILDAAGLDKATLVCSLTGPRFENLRSVGKIPALAKYAPDCDLSRTLFITDSHDDDAVAVAVAQAHLVVWVPYAPPAFRDLYVPMRYTVEGKYANTRYFTYQILQEDYALLLLAYAFSPGYAFGLWWLFLSLYAIYEIGYYENDHIAAAHETTPVIADAARAFPAHPRLKPWAWAILCAALAILVIRQAWSWREVSAALLLRDFGLWAGALIFTWVVFFAFNRVRPLRRVWLFPLLHLSKTFSFALLIPLTLVGALLLAAQTASISLNYAVYRLGGNLDRFNRQAWRLCLFLAFGAAAFALAPAAVIGTSPVRFSLMMAWCAVRAMERARRRNIVGIIVDLARRNRP